jgi:hypothetical protein
VRGGIAHAFNGSRQQADEFIKLGFALGFGGAMTFSGSTRIRELARSLPLESIVLETDAPDIPPAWLNGGRNSPAELAAHRRGSGRVARHDLRRRGRNDRGERAPGDPRPLISVNIPVKKSGVFLRFDLR